ncbi:hypothetical protein GJ688_10295 [Heliobacillus mobilis]|uniref:Uncharacterized protein n=1 Tax=Heliobacterium mobile TaxID=28064 RepID=A0A6I3SLK9_HELMO|nr:hypothetical protein [Heliobacterium mobile]MTV49367.1 hypothetical protein [Heliobacterium mobile]
MEDKKLPFANLSSEQMNILSQAEKQLNGQLGGNGEIIVLAYKNEHK